MFAIVEFIDTEEVEVVPAAWVDGDICVRPGGKADRVNRLVKACAEPQGEWGQHAGRVKGVFSSYECARRKLGRAEFTSDLASTDDEQRRVASKPKRFLTDSDSDENSPPKRKLPKKAHGSRAVYTAVPRKFPPPCTSDSNMQNSPNIRIMGGSACPPTASVASRDGIPQTDFQRQMLREIKVTRLMVGQILDLVENFPRLRVPEATSGASSLIPKPFLELRSFQDFDENISEVKEQLCQELKCLGGNNVANTTKRILTYIMDDSVAQNYSWVGNKGKEKFRDLNVTAVIMDVVRSNKTFSATLDEVEAVIKKWLQHVPCRRKQLQERHAKKAEATRNSGETSAD